MKWRVPFFHYPSLFQKRKEDYLKILSDVMDRGAFILQDDGRNFEKNFAKYVGVKHAFGISNCTDAMTIALVAQGIQRDDEVILPSHTMVGTPDAVIAMGAVPVLADCQRDHLLDPNEIKKLATRKTKALLLPQLNGRVAEMEPILEACKNLGIALIEDAAQAFGAKYNNQYAGTFGAMGAFSFYPAKVLGCFGDGGALVTNNDNLAHKIFLLRNHGCDPEGVIRRWGFNARLDNIQAAILNYKLEWINEEISSRRQLAAFYNNRLKNISQLILPPPPEEGRHFDVFQNYEIEAEQRDALRAHLTQKGIGTLLPWNGKAVHQWEELGFKVTLPQTEALFKKALLLPMNPFLTEQDLDLVCDEIENFYA